MKATQPPSQARTATVTNLNPNFFPQTPMISSGSVFFRANYKIWPKENFSLYNRLMPKQTDGLFPYVPRMVLARITDSPNFPTQPTTEQFQAAVLFADISGFTSLTEKLAAAGPQGVETLSRILNEYFGRITDQITKYGGDVVNFAGDSLLAVWDAGESRALPESVRMATQCAQQIQQAVQNYDSGVGAKISTRIGVGAGRIHIHYLGNEQHGWEYILSGEAATAAHVAEKQATPGQVVLSKAVVDLIQEVPGFLWNHDTLQLIDLPFIEVNELQDLPSPGKEKEISIQSFIAPAINSWLAAGQIDWLAELRRATILFINLGDFSNATPLEHIHRSITAIQEVIHHFEGNLHEIGMDEKGASPLITFGLHPLAHEDDPLRAVLAAQEISRLLNELGQPHSIGITTGRVFCGVIGGANRREYALFGDVVNTAARLMQAAAAHAIPILCDPATQQVAASRVKFTAMEPIHLKGKSEATPVFQPLPDANPSRPAPHHSTSFIGRAYEKQSLYEALLQVSQNDTAQVVVIEGEAGIGKSRLVEFIQDAAHDFGAVVCACAGDAVEKNTSYFGWRSAFRPLLGMEATLDSEANKERVLARLPENWRERAALLNPILGLDFDEPYFVSEMSGEVRAENVRALGVQLLSAASSNKALVVTFEDAHWQDSASWALSLDMSRTVRPLLFVLTTRPLEEPLPAFFQSLFAQPNIQRLTLGPLSPNEAVELVKQRLHVQSLPEDMADLIRSKAEGNPFFSEELAYSLRDSGLVEIRDNTCRVVGDVNLKTFSFPDTVQGIVTSRIDRLKPQEQLCIKVASVIGRIFAYRVLNEIHPIVSDRQHLQNYLDVLQKLDLTLPETTDPDLTYIFKHAITQDVAYNLMLFGQRQELHKIIALWYEQNFPGDLSPFYAVLAHHWRFAGDHEKALHYLEEATQQALDNFANREAVDFLNQIFQIDSQAPTADRYRRAGWYRRLGQAQKGLGNMEVSRSHLQTALRQMGYRVPKSQAGWVMDLLGQLLKRALFPVRKAESGSRQEAELQEAVIVFEKVSEIYYYAIDLPPFLACLLHLINTVERVGDSAEMARSYSVTALVAGLIPLHGLAKRYERYSMEIIAALGQFEDLAFALTALSLYNLGVGNFQQALRNMTRAVDSVIFLNNRPRMAEVFTIMAQVYQRLNRYPESFGFFERAYQAGLRSENPQHQVWGLNGKAGILLYQGGEAHAQQVIRLIQESIPLLVGSTDHTEDIRSYGMQGIAFLRLQQIELALRSADMGLRYIATTSPTAHDALEGYAGVAETCLRLLEARPADPSLAARVRKSLRGLTACANLFPVAKPRALAYQGWHAWVRGKKKKSEALWHQSLELARQLDMPYEEALTSLHMGRLLQNQDALEFAAQRFETLGAQYDLEQARIALK